MLARVKKTVVNFCSGISFGKCDEQANNLWCRPSRSMSTVYDFKKKRPSVIYIPDYWYDQHFGVSSDEVKRIDIAFNRKMEAIMVFLNDGVGSVDATMNVSQSVIDICAYHLRKNFLWGKVSAGNYAVFVMGSNKLAFVSSQESEALIEACQVM